MHIVDIYQASLQDLLKLQFSQPHNTPFTPISCVKQLYDIGHTTGNCLTKIEKIKYYANQILNNNWCVFEHNGWLFTVSDNFKLIDIVKIDPDSSISKQDLTSQINSVFVTEKKQTNMRLIKDITDHGWARYNFVGTIEDKPYTCLKCVSTNDMKMVVCNPDQINNPLQKVIQLDHVIDDTYISVDCFDSQDDCLRLYRILPGSIHITDYNGDDIITFDVRGSVTK